MCINLQSDYYLVLFFTNLFRSEFTISTQNRPGSD